MEKTPPIVLAHGGYSKLIVFDKSEVIYQGTVVFCRRFLVASKDRTVDQMVQAARSCKQNIAGRQTKRQSRERSPRSINHSRVQSRERSPRQVRPLYRAAKRREFHRRGQAKR